MKTTTLIVVGMLVAGIASAGELEGLGGELNSAKAELPGLNQTMSETTDANISLKKENDLYIADQEQKKAALQKAIDELIKNIKEPAEQKLADVVGRYNARCNRTFDRDTEMGAYNQCVSDKRAVEQESANAAQWWKDYATRWDHENVDPVNAVIKKQNVRLAEIGAQMKANFKRFTDAQDRSLALRARIKEIIKLFKSYCADKSAPSGGAFTRAEWEKWCGNVDWDGARRDLAPMYKYQGTGGITAN